MDGVNEPEGKTYRPVAATPGDIIRLTDDDERRHRSKSDGNLRPCCRGQQGNAREEDVGQIHRGERQRGATAVLNDSWRKAVALEITGGVMTRKYGTM